MATKKKIWQLITEETWTKKRYARDCTGKSCGVDSDAAIKFCADGWLCKVYPPYDDGSVSYNSARRKLAQVIRNDNIVAWNDRQCRTFEDVKAAFKKANI